MADGMASWVDDAYEDNVGTVVASAQQAWHVGVRVAQAVQQEEEVVDHLLQ
eukprot:CAMPEP_0203636862 /NCGR_PEP_ID=MMETSP0088-20131115/3320_1 /ASSEMBLY_ACC=CAM_ASM_001087 /TAXON_ID=426623 /ORGANISM="Chaetoceros affinis, Strain CCMP159" /LENGTH=50 /DNA_ID=CAMNT_0050491129 /DNA_START=156 /DNA_END=308 /DNA_ORIENTATION=-